MESYLSLMKHLKMVPFLIVSSVDCVPQGTCLGPLFFVLYSNDINYLFADHSTMLISNSNHELLAAKADYYLYRLKNIKDLKINNN